MKEPKCKNTETHLWISFTPVYSAACFGTVCENLLYVHFIAVPSTPKLCLNETRIEFPLRLTPWSHVATQQLVPTFDALVSLQREPGKLETPTASFHMFTVDSSKQSLTHSKPNWQVEIKYVGKLDYISLRVFVWCFGLLVWNPRNSPQPLARSPFRRSSLPSFHDSLPTHSGDWRETHS